MASDFNLSRENREKLWVQTPFPVSHVVWDFFVKAQFPEFVDPVAHPASRYINRTFGGNGAELADGQIVEYHTHAFLPDDKRSGLSLSDWGLVYSPDKTEYLDEFSDVLNRPNHTSLFILETLQAQQRETIKKILELHAVHGLRPQSQTGGQGFPSVFDSLNLAINSEFSFSLNLTGRERQFVGRNNDLIPYLGWYFAQDLRDRFKGSGGRIREDIDSETLTDVFEKTRAYYSRLIA